MKLKIVIAILTCISFSQASCRSEKPHNPYLDLKDKPSERLRRSHDRVGKKHMREFKRNSKKSKRRLGF